MIRWEYKYFKTSRFDDNDLKRINMLGQEGWELVCTEMMDVPSNSDWKTYFFKRPIPEKKKIL